MCRGCHVSSVPIEIERVFRLSEGNPGDWVPASIARRWVNIVLTAGAQ